MKALHDLIAGPSGGGKTTYARKRFYYHDGPAIWVNHSDEDRLPGTVCKTETEIKNQIEKQGDAARIVYPWNGDPEHGPDIPIRVGVSYSGTVAIFIDEGSAVMPEGADRTENSTAWAFHEARDKGVAIKLITQDPTELSYPPIKNIRYMVWAGPVKTWHRGFRNYYSLPADMFPKENHHYHVIEPTDPPEVVYRGETDPDFA